MTEYLRNKQVYLSGAIEFDTGDNWRVEPVKMLRERFGLDVFDPFADPKQNWVPEILKAREERNYDFLFKKAKDFVRKDLSTVDESQMLIAYLPYKVPTTGTVHEIINSNNAKKPTLLVTNMNDISYLPIWYFGFIRPEFMFPNWEALYNYLDEVNQGLHRHNNRWSRIYGDI